MNIVDEDTDIYITSCNGVRSQSSNFSNAHTESKGPLPHVWSNNLYEKLI